MNREMKSTKKEIRALWESRYRWPAIAGVATFALVVTTLCIHRTRKVTSTPAAPPVPASLFSTNYPVDEHFRQELQLMRSQNKLSTKNETRINQAIQKTSGDLSMPPAVLWCLLFQESRLNHLEGIGSERGALGIGQFSFFSFYEINHHLNRFNGDNLTMFRHVLGKDIRPLLADENNVDSQSSYFYIPTAVAASGAYLNNRYRQLSQILDRRHYAYQPQLMWLYAAMAYNKGTRSVLSLWNDSLRRKGKGGPELAQLLVDDDSFHTSMSNERAVVRTLKKIWPADQAASYGHELRIHLQNMWDCAVDRTQTASAPEATPQGARF